GAPRRDAGRGRRLHRLAGAVERGDRSGGGPACELARERGVRGGAPARRARGRAGHPGGAARAAAAAGPGARRRAPARRGPAAGRGGVRAAPRGAGARDRARRRRRRRGQRGPRMTPSVSDVAVVGGGPGGSTVANHLARGGLSVALFEREVFPRFKVGESLVPATMLLLKRLGALEPIERGGFQIKYGATFHDQERGIGTTFYFLKGMPWPEWTYNVQRGEFDTILLEHARKQGVQVVQPATVRGAAFDAEGVTLEVETHGEVAQHRARFLVDASGRDSFLASRIGQRTRVPNLGKVALYAYYRGADRFPGREIGNVRMYLFEGGWFWWIPLSNDLTSIGAVLHARTVREFAGTPEEL